MKTHRLGEVCRRCGIEERLVVQFVTEEWVHPVDRADLTFDEIDLARISFIQELRDDFGINDEAIPVILHLVDQLNEIQRRSKRW